MKKIFNIIVMLLPWFVRRPILNKFYNYKIHPTAKIGLSYIYPQFLQMDAGATIGHLNVAIHLESIFMGEMCTISQKNWITGYPLKNKNNFQEFPNRIPQLIMRRDSAITKQHLIDCTDTVIIGELTSIGGYNTQILSHSTSLEHNRQGCSPITIGHHCFVGTRCIILPGSVLPDQSVLGAGAVLNKKYTETLTLYAGVPAKAIQSVNNTYKFFNREERPKG